MLSLRLFRPLELLSGGPVVGCGAGVDVVDTASEVVARACVADFWGIVTPEVVSCLSISISVVGITSVGSDKIARYVFRVSNRREAVFQYPIIMVKRNEENNERARTSINFGVVVNMSCA